ncbi:uncharacterized protein JN550_011963 [Neoarthrinium moseri]|uniref:uncharacterized protein n=1 Tax=Neoarthrinium moseri TaxID=1658444 RepID=UPI001FDE3F90|nr:uncharacterized protein JN550_011963 [Neoarthrinium moseri]KAI1859555.1 hypothetical protein JN550_011963 [Neoarthrinium moseri]
MDHRSASQIAPTSFHLAKVAMLRAATFGNRKVQVNNGPAEYKPISHQWPFLALLGLLLCTLVGAIEMVVLKPSNKADFGYILSHRQDKQKRSEILAVTTDLQQHLTATGTSGAPTECTLYRTVWLDEYVGSIVTTVDTFTSDIVTILSTSDAVSALVTRTAEVLSPSEIGGQDCITSTKTSTVMGRIRKFSTDFANINTATVTKLSTVITEVPVPTSATWMPPPEQRLPPAGTMSDGVNPLVMQEEQSSRKADFEVNIKPSNPVVAVETTILATTAAGRQGSNTDLTDPTASTTELPGSAVGSSEKGPSGQAVVTSAILPGGKSGILSFAAAGVPSTSSMPLSFSSKTLVRTLIDSHGHAISTVEYLGWIAEETSILTDSQGVPTATLISSVLVSPYTTILKDDGDKPIATTTWNSTLVRTPTFRPSGDLQTLLPPSDKVLTDSNGNRVTTNAFSTRLTKPRTTLTDSRGVPTATLDVPKSTTTSIIKEYTSVWVISKWQYFSGMFLPTLLATLVSIPLRLINLNAKRLQPFHAMMQPYGASAGESVCLRTAGPRTAHSSIASLTKGDCFLFLTTLLSTFSVVLAPLAAEAISIKTDGDCAPGGGTAAENCAVFLFASSVPVRLTEGLLILMATTLLLILLLSLRRRSGVRENPWSISGLAAIMTDHQVRDLFCSHNYDTYSVSNAALMKKAGNRRFRLDYFGREDWDNYGIMIADSNRGIFDLARRKENTSNHAHTQKHQPIFALRLFGLSLHLALICGILVLVLYYYNTGGDTPFEHFMDGESFGVRFLFTALGIVNAHCWSAVFNGVAILGPYKRMSECAQPAERSILQSPSTNPFSGLWSAVKRREALLGTVAAAAIFSECLPILLSNVPYSVTQTYVVYLVCHWLTVSILGLMASLLVYMFFVQWPHLPADMRSIAGAAYYLASFSLPGKREVDPKPNSGISQLMYRLCEVKGDFGYVRVGIEAVNAHEAYV